MMPNHCNEFDIKVTEDQTSNGWPRCKYGNKVGERTRSKIALHHQYLHNLAEAMHIDSFFAGDLSSCQLQTTSLLFRLFDVAYHWYVLDLVISSYILLIVMYSLNIILVLI